MIEQTCPIADLDSEQTLIAGCLHEPEKYLGIRIWLPPSSFYQPEAAALWEMIDWCMAEGVPIEYSAFRQKIRAGDFPRKGDLDDYAHKVFEAAFMAHPVEHLAKVVHELSQRRTFQRWFEAMAERCVQDESQSIRTATEAFLAKMQERNDSSRGGRVGDILHDQVLPDLEKQRQGDSLHGVPTGIRALDEVTGGLKPGDLIVVGARPSTGKTALSVQIASHVSSRAENAGVAFLSLEMEPSQIVQRMLAASSGVAYGRLGSPYLSPKEREQENAAVEFLTPLTMHIESPRNRSAASIAATVRALKRRHGELGLVVIDHLQFMAEKGSKHQNRNAEISAISADLKQLARQEGVPVLLLSQLNRGVEHRVDKRPNLADLRDSGSIEQDADVVVMIYNNREENEAELIVAKNRNGQTGTIPVVWDGETMTFQEIERRGVAV